MIDKAYYASIASIDFSKIKVLQLRDDTSFTKMDICNTMTLLRNNPFDMNNSDKSYYDMIVIWTGACGLAIISANDKRFPKVSSNEYDGCLTMSKIKKDKGLFSVLERKKCFTQVSLPKGAYLKIWENPFGIRAATDYDKLFGDRWYWENGKLLWVDEGNKYGDTSMFLMFGMIEDRPNQFRKQLKS